MHLPQYVNEIINTLIYPHNCCGCGHHLPNTHQVLCWRCTQDLPLTGFEQQQNNPVERIFTGRIPVHHAASLLFFVKESLTQQLLHQVKYKKRQDVGLYLGRRIGEALLNANWNIDCIVPLPLNQKKQAQRGYNQAELLAKGISELLQKPVENVAVIRTRNNATQTKKNRVERWENVNEIFDLHDNHTLYNQHVLLVDDVVTTGATLEACGQVLLQTPGVSLSIITAAFASKI